MNREFIESLLQDLLAGERSSAEVTEELAGFSWQSNLGHSQVDLHRELRTGFSEVVLAEKKTVEQLQDIAAELVSRNQNLLITRVPEEKATVVLSFLKQRFPSVSFSFHPEADILTGIVRAPRVLPGSIGIVSAGTSDFKVASEARLTAEFFGAKVKSYPDCGVAGLHRLLGRLDELRKEDLLIAIAGMEGALPSVLAGLVEAPVLAVPVSSGYGAHLGGVTPLLSMLSSCSGPLAVLNIDNGFGAAQFACAVLRRSVQIQIAER